MGYINNGFNVVYKSALFVLPARTDQDNTYTTAFTVSTLVYSLLLLYILKTILYLYV